MYKDLYKFKAIEQTLTQYNDIESKYPGDSELSRVLKMIKNNAVWFAHPVTLNDPFEFQFYHASGKSFDSITGKLQLMEDLKIGVFSMTPNIQHPVLWSMYADRYQGLALRINSKAFQFLNKVIYRDEAYRIPEDIEDDPNHHLNEVICSKSKHWHYEDEVRSLQEKQGNVELLVPEAITEVILGDYMAREMKQFVVEKINEINQTRQNKISLKEAVPALEGYAINIENYNPNRIHSRFVKKKNK